MPPAGIGVSPINPLSLEPPDILQRSQPARFSIGGVSSLAQTEGGSLVQAPAPSISGAEVENNLDSSSLFETLNAARSTSNATPHIPSEPPQLEEVINQGIGGQIDLVA